MKRREALTLAIARMDLEHTVLREARHTVHTACDPTYVKCPKQAHPQGQEVG